MHQKSEITPAEANASGSGEPEKKIKQIMQDHKFVSRKIIFLNAIITVDIEHHII